MRGPALGGNTAARLLPALVIGVCLATAVVPQPAAAQFFGWGGNDGWAGGWGGGHWGGLRPGEIGRSIADQGFRVISPLRRNGSVFVADVVDRRGRRERLIVAAADAQILQRFYLDDPRLPGSLPRNDVARGTPDESDWDNRSDVVPPASIPRQGRRQTFGSTGAPDASLDNYGQPSDGLRQDDGGVEPQRLRPAQKAPKPKPRVVDRTPDSAPLGPRDLTPALTARPQPKPSDATRDPVGPAQTVGRPVEASPKVANTPPAAAPVVTPATPSQPAGTAAATGSPRMRDPLAIPGSEVRTGSAKPATTRPSNAAAEPAPRTVSSGTTAAPAQAKPGDVPVAPLD